MSVLNLPWSRWRQRFTRQRVLTVAVVLGLLLVEAALPRLFGFGGPTLWLMALVGIAYLLLAATRPHLALLALLCYAPFAAHLRFRGLSNFQSLLKDLAALGLVGLWVLRLLVQRRKLARTPLDIPLLIFLALAGINALRGPTLLRGLLALKIIATYIPIYFLVVNEPPSRRQLRLFLRVLLIVGAVTAIYGLYQVATIGGEEYTLQIEGQTLLAARRFGQLRVFSTFTNSQVFSLFLVMSIMLALGLERGTSSGREKLALWVIMGLMAANLPATLTRMGWIGFLLGSAVHLWLSRHSKQGSRLLLILVVLLVFGFILGGPIMQRVLNWSFSAEDLSYRGRKELIKWAYIMIFVEQAQGCGLGSLRDAAELAQRVTKTYQPPYTCFWHGYAITGADTVALSIGVQMGLVGYLSYVALFVVLWWSCMRVYRCLSDPLLKGGAAGILAYLAVMTISNFFAGNPQAYPVVDLYFWFFVGLLMSLKRIEAQSQQLEIQDETPSGCG